MRNSVVLPQPDGPEQGEELVLGGISRLTSFTATLAAERFVIVLDADDRLAGSVPCSLIHGT